MQGKHRAGFPLPRQKENPWLGDGIPLVSEDDCLAVIDTLFPRSFPHAPKGRGHDCAELVFAPQTKPILPALSPLLALSTDLFWENTHFRTRYFTPEETGAKALSVAVSDLAAAGAVPLGFSLGLMLPPAFTHQAFTALMRGMAQKAWEYGIGLSGGDLIQGDLLGFSLTVWGQEAAPGTGFLQRNKALPGDYVFLVGEAGLARAGWWLLEKKGRAACRSWPAACAALLSPKPLLAEGRALALLAATLKKQEGTDKNTARIGLMDLSDGLARDLPRLLGGAGVDLSLSPEDIPKETRAVASLMKQDAEELFLLSGDDYALLGSCPETTWPAVQKTVPSARLLGKVRLEPGIFHAGRKIFLAGFDHFASSPTGMENGQEGKNIPLFPLNSASIQDASCELIAVCREAWEGGLMAGFNGNASSRVRIPQTASGTKEKEACLITRSGVAKSHLREEDFALLSLFGKTMAGPTASTESALHRNIYRVCPRSTFILHTHPPRLLALGLALPPEKRLDLPLPEATHGRSRLAWVPFFLPGTRELATATATAAKNFPAIWLERHGLVVHGEKLDDVLALTEELEHLAGVHLAMLAAKG